jgi:MYXO-CTERM domain-containing protein
LEASPAIVVEPFAPLAPGLWEFGVAAPSGTGGEELTLRVLFGSREIVRRTVPIAVDRWVAERGTHARGGCAIHADPEPPLGAIWLVLLAGGWWLRRRRRPAT